MILRTVSAVCGVPVHDIVGPDYRAGPVVTARRISYRLLIHVGNLSIAATSRVIGRTEATVRAVMQTPLKGVERDLYVDCWKRLRPDRRVVGMDREQCWVYGRRNRSEQAVESVQVPDDAWVADDNGVEVALFRFCPENEVKFWNQNFERTPDGRFEPRGGLSHAEIGALLGMTGSASQQAEASAKLKLLKGLEGYI